MVFGTGKSWMYLILSADGEIPSAEIGLLKMWPQVAWKHTLVGWSQHHIAASVQTLLNMTHVFLFIVDSY